MKKKKYTREFGDLRFRFEFRKETFNTIVYPHQHAAFGVKPKIFADRAHTNAPAYAFTLDPIRRDQRSSAACVCVQITVTT